MENKPINIESRSSGPKKINLVGMKRDFEGLKSYIIDRLDKELPEDLYYHSIEHTLDVLDSALRIGTSEKISEKQTVLLRAAVMLHDFGFVSGYANHEELGCDLAVGILPQFGYTEEDAKTICGLIMATKVPQAPNDHLQQIICDADLDYLGREDFYPIGNRLFREFASRGIVKDEDDWNCLQIRFLSNHRYFTETNLRDREEIKLGHLQQLKDLNLACD